MFSSKGFSFNDKPAPFSRQCTTFSFEWSHFRFGKIAIAPAKRDRLPQPA
ncbi:MAG: hypothetical protein KME12_06510 [Trichocoleus desertorum ATA4-8-CV12]|nr:hypothetical protein [Trichocoleus desertorum ATA4-8-CV12]